MDEFELIRRHFGGAVFGAAAAGVRLGIGDDAALIEAPTGQQLALCCDTLVAGRHFDAAALAEDVGWKALAVNLSDLAAMGAEPLAFLLSLTLPEADEAWLTGFARGLRSGAERFGLQLIGGDTSRGPLSVTITALGSLPAGSGLRRDGARPGDLVAVTGVLGSAAAALAGAGAPPLQAALHRPQPRLAAGRALRGIATATIDISDGLLADLGHVASASGVGIDLRADLLPADPAFAQLADGERRLQWQATGGDDYELAVCLPPERVSEAVAACAALDLPLTVIGRVRAVSQAERQTTPATAARQAPPPVAAAAAETAAEGSAEVRLLDAQGRPFAMAAVGYRHFTAAPAATDAGPSRARTMR